MVRKTAPLGYVPRGTSRIHSRPAAVFRATWRLQLLNLYCRVQAVRALMQVHVDRRCALLVSTLMRTAHAALTVLKNEHHLVVLVLLGLAQQVVVHRISPVLLDICVLFQ